MARKKVGHPTWFKMSAERQEFLKSIPAETAVNCLMNCFKYLENRQKPELNALDNVCFSVFMPELENAWAAYDQRTEAGFQNGGTAVHDRTRPNTGALDIETETDRQTETETETETDRQTDNGGCRGAGCLAGWPDLDSVLSFAAECGAGEEMARTFYELNTGRNWSINGSPIRDWKKLFCSWLEHEKKKKPPQRGGAFFTDEDIERNMKYCL